MASSGAPRSCVEDRSRSVTFFELVTLLEADMAPSHADILRAGPTAPDELARASVLSDEALVREILTGRTALFEILMRRHNERLYRAARAILRDDGEAEDVMQQAYVNAYAHLRQFDGRASFATWLTRIAVYEALARIRRRRRFDALDSYAPAT